MVSVPPYFWREPGWGSLLHRAPLNRCIHLAFSHPGLYGVAASTAWPLLPPSRLLLQPPHHFGFAVHTDGAQLLIGRVERVPRRDTKGFHSSPQFQKSEIKPSLLILFSLAQLFEASCWEREAGRPASNLKPPRKGFHLLHLVFHQCLCVCMCISVQLRQGKQNGTG